MNLCKHNGVSIAIKVVFLLKKASVVKCVYQNSVYTLNRVCKNSSIIPIAKYKKVNEILSTTR